MTRCLIGYNILSDTVADRASLLQAVETLSASTLVMDGGGYARQVRDRLPRNRVVVFRAYRPDDHELFVKITPSQWIQSIAPYAAPNIYIQCHNEPVVTQDNVTAFVQWTVEAMNIAKTLGIRLATPSFAVGNPHERLIENGAFDPILRALDDHHVLLTHEYFQSNAAQETPWLTGRIAFWLSRLKGLGIRVPHVIIGEYGRDVGGGQYDGWRDTGWSETDYATRLYTGVRDVYEPLAAAHACHIHLMVYCAGSGYGNRWASFDVERRTSIHTILTRYNQGYQEQPVTTPETVNWGKMIAGTATTPQGAVRVRQSTSVNSRHLDTIQAGARIQLSEFRHTFESRQWNRVQIVGNGITGYVASEFIVLNPDGGGDPVPPVDPGIGVPSLTDDEIQQHIDANRLLLEHLSNIANAAQGMKMQIEVITTILQALLNRRSGKT